MLFFVLMPLLMLIVVPVLGLWLGTWAALWAKRAAARHRDIIGQYPVAEMLDATFEPEMEQQGIWPPQIQEKPEWEC